MMKKTIHVDGLSIRETCLDAYNLLNDWNLVPEDRDDVLLSIDEALTNILEHGYNEKAGEVHPVTIEIIEGKEELYIVIADFAKPFSLENTGMPNKDTYLQSNLVGGFGVFIIKAIMNYVRVFQLFDENVLIMQKRIRHIPLT